MFDVAPTELMLVAAVALVVIGPKDLPRAMRVVGRWVAKAQGVARHFRSGLDEMVRQAELEEMEAKWAAENERIMREHPADAATPSWDEVPPDTVAQPVMEPLPAPTSPEPEEPVHAAEARSDEPMLPFGDGQREARS